MVKDFLPATEKHLKLLRVYCQRVLKLKSSANLVVSNGKMIGPLDATEYFTVEDFGLLEKFSNHQYIDKIKKALKESSKDTDGMKLTIFCSIISYYVIVL